MVSVILPKKMDEEIGALVSAGYYDNKSEIIRAAFRLFLAKKAELRLAVAIELYKKKRSTISRAAEVAGIPYEEMKSILIDEKLIRRGVPSGNVMKKRAGKLVGMVK
ncbi:MAG: UPF0175 family protein [Candidatus Omnitrophica bacterium]|nr:UPF0175 family protein [Candidatus Omnitrophota bacterium]